MVPDANLLAFALAALLLIAVPGPSVLFVIGRTLALGRRGGLLSVLGNAVGELLQIAAVALGVGVVLAQSVLLLGVVKFAGAAYLVYLGIQAIRHRGSGTTAAEPSRPASTLRLFREGFIVGATNPKSIVFFVAVLPSLWTTRPAPFPCSSGYLGGLFLAIALASDSGWALVAGTARRWFASSPGGSPRWAPAGGAMIGLGGTLALAGNAADPRPGK